MSLLNLLGINLKELLNPQFYIEHGGLWMIIFIVFAETGLFAGFFLPGDALLFVTGIYSDRIISAALFPSYNQWIDLSVLWVLITTAGVLGNFIGYWFGRKSGPYLYERKDSFFFKKKYLMQAHDFYEKNGGQAIVIARFIPFVRTFAPIIAGIVKMDRKKFTYYNILGCMLWVGSMLLGGHFLQKLIENQFGFDLKEHLDIIVIGIIILTTFPVIWKVFLSKKKSYSTASEERPLKFLIIRFSSIGDIVLTTPVIRSLRKKFPDASIHYLTKKKFATILESNPYLDKVILFEHDLTSIIRELESEHYSYIIDLHHNLRTLRLKRALKKTTFYAFPKLNFRKWIYTNFKINLMPQKHILDRYMETVKKLGVQNDGLGLDYFIPEPDQVKEGDLPFSHSHGYIAIAIGAAHNTKKLPLEKLKELVEKIEHPIVLLGGKEDFLNGEKIAAPDTVKVYNACGKFSLNESADIIRNSTLVISHDTGLMHIASAFKKNILSVWGNTVPSFGMVPYKTSYQVFQVNKLMCRPCSKTGFDECPLGHFKCMNDQSINAIASQAEKLLKKLD